MQGCRAAVLLKPFLGHAFGVSMNGVDLHKKKQTYKESFAFICSFQNFPSSLFRFFVHFLSSKIRSKTKTYEIPYKFTFCIFWIFRLFNLCVTIINATKKEWAKSVKQFSSDDVTIHGQMIFIYRFLFISNWQHWFTRSPTFRNYRYPVWWAFHSRFCELPIFDAANWANSASVTAARPFWRFHSVKILWLHIFLHRQALKEVNNSFRCFWSLSVSAFTVSDHGAR